MTRRSFISAAVLASLMASPAMAKAPAGSGTFAPERVPVVSVEKHIQLVRREISPREAKSIALSRVRGGEVVDIRRVRDTYRVRIIARDGRVVDIVIDANTGRIR